MPQDQKTTVAEQAVIWAGGVDALAKKIGCSRTVTSWWVNGRRPLSIAHALRLQKASKGKFKAKEIRPELF